MSYNDIYDDLLYNQPADYFTQALSDGHIKTIGNSLESGYNTVSNQFNKQVEMVKELSRQINTHSTPLVWVIIFVLFFIIIII